MLYSIDPAKGGTQSMKSTIAVIHPYWNFWESSVPGDLRANRHKVMSDAINFLLKEFDVTASGFIASAAEGKALTDDCKNVHALVVISSMAVPPATGMAFLENLPEVPVVIWALSPKDSLDVDFNHSDISTSGATVGAPMIGSALARLGRPFDVVVSSLQSPDGISAAVRRACAAGHVRQARMVRIGEKMIGYTSVDVTTDVLKNFGPTIIDIAPEELVTRSQNIHESEIAQTHNEIESEFDGVNSVDPVAMNRVIRAEIALRNILKDNSANVGTINCHVRQLRPSADFGVAPCFALGRLTSAGIPWTCTGDVLTSIAMLAVKSLGLPTLYHEVEALDHDNNEAILANTGEHDLGFCGATKPEIVTDVWYGHDPIKSPCASFSIPAGPASLIGFVYAPEPRFVVAEGEFTGRRSPATGTPNAGFRFNSGPVRQAWQRWANAGVIHHSAATNAHIADDIEVIARHLGASFFKV